MSAAFYCVTGSDFFLGTVALINSLRLLGHDEPVYVLDCGLRSGERALLEREATVVSGSRHEPPSIQKLTLPLAKPAQTVVMLDADIIVTGRLSEPIKLAGEGRLVAFRNESERYFEQWAEVTGSPGLRRGPYLSSGAVFAGREVAGRLLPSVADALARLDPAATWLAQGSEADPLFYADQDLLNAYALAGLDAERVVALDPALAPVPPFRGLRILDLATLAVGDGAGRRPLMLHHFFRKPWLVRMKSNVYSRIMTRLLTASDVALQVEPSRVPLRLRSGPAGAVSRLAVDVGVGVPSSARRRVRGRPRRISAWPHSSGGAS